MTIASGDVQVCTSELSAATWNDRCANALLLAAGARRHETTLSASDVGALMRQPQSGGLAEVLPTFGAAAWVGTGQLRVVADALGFRQIYLAEAASSAAVSTAAHVLAPIGGRKLDEHALAVQSHLGWQLGQRTLYAGVEKLAAGAAVTLAGGRASTARYVDDRLDEELSLVQGVADGAAILRRYLEAFLDDHPDAILQLTGGLDSRILLGAIPPARRRGLRAVTLFVPGVPDLEIASALTERFEMEHEVLTLDGLESLDPEAAYELCVHAALALDCTADPLAYAALAFAERRAEPGPRLSGLGGEVARGFYYLGLDPTAKVTRSRAHRLAAWRMLANQAVSPDVLDPAFAAWARAFTETEIFRVLRETGKPWFAACDELYLAHRMQRWGGVTESAFCMQREVSNPMLDDRFLSVAQRLPPVAKRGSRFLSRLLLALDAELAYIPLENRPAPVAYSRASVTASSRRMASLGRKVLRKGLQRLRHGTLPPAGGEVLARKVVDHWRTRPGLLSAAAETGVIAQKWIDGVLAGDTHPAPATVAFALNVTVAQHLARTGGEPTAYDRLR